MQRRVLGDEARAYLRSRLESGKTLSSMLLERLDLAVGTIWTVVPPDLRHLKAAELEDWLWDDLSLLYEETDAGARFSDEKAIAIHQGVLHDLRQYLSQHPDSYLVFESLNHHPPGAPSGLAKGIEKVAAEVTHGDDAGLIFYPEVQPGFVVLSADGRNLSGPGDGEVYMYVAGPNPSTERIETVMRNAESWLLTGVLTTLPARQGRLTPNQWVTRTQLELMADGAELILVDAFDGEGYLAWSRS